MIPVDDDQLRVHAMQKIKWVPFDKVPDGHPDDILVSTCTLAGNSNQSLEKYLTCTLGSDLALVILMPTLQDREEVNGSAKSQLKCINMIKH